MDYFSRLSPNARIGAVIGACVVIAVVAYLIYGSLRGTSKRSGGASGGQRAQPVPQPPANPEAVHPSVDLNPETGMIEEGYSEVDGNDLGESQKMMVLFHMSGCGPCGAFMPTWDEFTRRHNGAYGVHIVKVNGPENRDLTNQFSVKGFPSVMFCPHGIANPTTAVEYTGNRSLADLETFLKQHA
jgi:hypothetical protein